MKYPLLCALVLALASCGDSGTSEANKTETKTETSAPAGPELKNGITVKENGLKVSKAMLLHADGSEIGNDNTVAVGEEILCRLFISGWKDEGGRVKLGASQTAKTAEGAVVLEQPDMFSSIESASVEDAGVVTINATVTDANEQIKDLTVAFKVWDKVSNADITGQYTFHLK